MLRKLWLKLFRRRQLHQDLQDEMAFHREMSAASGNGIPFGNTAVIQEQSLDLWRFVWLENLWRDTRMAARHLRANPALVAAALLSLGLGIGVNLTLFSIATEFLMSVPSVAEPDRVVRVRFAGSSHSNFDVLRFVQDARAFEQVTGMWEEAALNWNDGADTRRIVGVVAEPNYFDVLKTPLAIGRPFTQSDSHNTVVLHHHFWRTRFQADPAILGRTLNLDGRPYQVIGVLPESHRTLMGFGYTPDVYLPRYSNETRTSLYVRLRANQPLEEARQIAQALAVQMDAALPRGFAPYQESVQVDAVSGFPRLKNSLKGAAVFMAVLLALAVMVLLIACINVAGILLAEAASRQREMAIRVSLGAGRGRLLQQLLVESSLLAAIGAATGFLFARASASLLSNLSLPLPVPLRVIVSTDWRLVAYGVLLAALTTIVCGLLPALQSVRESMTQDLTRFNRQRLRRLLVGAQIAVSMVILVTGFLFFRNTLAASALDPGFDLNRTANASVNLPPQRYADAPAVNAYVLRAVESLSAVPGVETVAVASVVPFKGGSTRGGDLFAGDTGEATRLRIHMNAISPEYFAAMGIPILQGRTFLPDEKEGVVVVNRSFAQKMFGTRNPLSSYFRWAQNGQPVRIAGVVEDSKCMMIGEEGEPQVFEPWNGKGVQRVEFVVRTALPPAQLVDPLRRALRAVEPAAANEVEPLRTAIGFAFLPSQLGAGFMGAIGLVGLLLVVIGLYGTLAYTVSRRMQEFAVRLAIGAKPGSVATAVLKDSLRLVVAGGAIGLAIAFFVTKPLAMFLAPGLSPHDPWSFALVPAALLLAGLAAAIPAAIRAASVDPASTLRVN